MDLANQFAPRFCMEKNEYGQISLLVEYRNFYLRKELARGELNQEKISMVAFTMMTDLEQKIRENNDGKEK